MAATVFIDGNASGMRLVKSSGSRLSVLVIAVRRACAPQGAPFALGLHRLRDRRPFANQRPEDLYRSRRRRAKVRRSARQHYRREPHRSMSSSAAGDTFDKVTAPYVEGRLIGICTDLNIPLANSGRPFGRGLGIMDDLEQLVGHVETLLSVAGFTRIEMARRDPPALRHRLSVTTDRDELVAMTEAGAKLRSSGWPSVPT